jgi:hypothetical protein
VACASTRTILDTQLAKDAHAETAFIDAVYYMTMSQRAYGNARETRDACSKARVILQKLLAGDPDARTKRQWLVDSLACQARAEAVTGTKPTARDLAAEAVENARRLVDASPSSTGAQSALGTALAAAADVDAATAALALSEERYRAALDAYAKASSEDPDVQTDSAAAMNGLARVLLARATARDGARAEARAWVERAIASLAPLDARGRLSARGRVELRAAREVLARAR